MGKSHGGFRCQISDDSNLFSSSLDNDRLLEEALHGRLVGHVHVGADDREADVRQEGNVTADAVIKLVISGRLKTGLNRMKRVLTGLDLADECKKCHKNDNYSLNCMRNSVKT